MRPPAYEVHELPRRRRPQGLLHWLTSNGELIGFFLLVAAGAVAIVTWRRWL